MASLTIAPIVTPNLLAPLLSPHQGSALSGMLKEKTIPVMQKTNEAPGPEKSKKLRELIESQMKKVEAVAKKQEEVAVSVTVTEPSKMDPEGNNPAGNGLVTVIEEKSDDENGVLCLGTALNQSPICSVIKIKKQANGAAPTSLKGSLTAFLSGTSKALNCIFRFYQHLATIDTMKASPKNDSAENRDISRKESMIQIESSVEDTEEESEHKKHVKESLAELLKSIDLREVREEIQCGLMGKCKEDVDRAKYIAKIRARMQKKNGK